MQTIRRGIVSLTAPFLLTSLALVGLGLAGCGNTLSGAKQDASTDTQKVATATDQAAAKTATAAHKVGQEVKDVPQDMDSAAAVTPEVKTAIIRDPVLNNPGNVINVDSHDHVTHLKGHVLNASMKSRAAEDAQTELSKRHPNYKVSNELTVGGGSTP